MARVHIPAAMRPTAGGAAQVEVEGATLAEVVDNLEAQFPGLKSRLVDNNRIRSALAVFIDGTQSSNDLQNRVNPQSEIYFAPAMSGGRTPSFPRRREIQNLTVHTFDDVWRRQQD